MTNRLLVMVSNNSLSLKSATDQRRAMTLLASNKIPYELLDGMDPARKERRNELFSISGIRGQYPQFFTLDENDNATFLGNWETIEGINDSSSLPYNILEANPSIVTWRTVLPGVAPSS